MVFSLGLALGKDNRRDLAKGHGGARRRRGMGFFPIVLKGVKGRDKDADADNADNRVFNNLAGSNRCFG